MATAAKSLIDRRLYRSLLRAGKPFSQGYRNARVRTCLLHRSGWDDDGWDDFLRDEKEKELSLEKDVINYRSLFQKLLRELIAGDTTNGIRQMVFPRNAQLNKLNELIRREFRDGDDSLSAKFDKNTRREVAFVALRELNKKLVFEEKLRSTADVVHPQQAARDVIPLPTNSPSAYLRPGAYLVSHPNLEGYFRRAVLCILDHKEDGIHDGSGYGTYGLIINRPCKSEHSGKNLTLEEVLRPLPPDLAGAFGSTLVKEGGPVQMSLQMVHSLDPEQEELKIGGQPLSMIPDEQLQSTAIHSNRAIYYKGDIANAARAVISGHMDQGDVSFFVGASSWAVGQLESEIERGCWLPCRGPIEIAHSGICDHDPTPKGQPRPKADLWLSMLSACGKDEAELAHLVFNDDGEDELGASCDDDYTYVMSFKD